jgi:hypothetical protein
MGGQGLLAQEALCSIHSSTDFVAFYWGLQLESDKEY